MQVKVQSMDSKVFEIPAKVAKMSVTLKNLIEGTPPIPTSIMVCADSSKHPLSLCQTFL